MENKKNNIIIGINLCYNGSTGAIMRNALEYAHINGDFDYLIVLKEHTNKPNTFCFFESNTIIDKIDRRLFHKSLGNPDGLYEYRATKRIINKIHKMCKIYKNVIIHMHNIHMSYIDFRILFSYLSKNTKIKKVFYTIHDCWPFTGGCYSYTYVKCDQWKNGCDVTCPQRYGTNKYPVSKVWDLKKEFTLLLKKKMTLFPVSHWINNEINKSFLKSFERVIIYGETNIQKLDYKDTSIIDKYSLHNKKIVLTVSAYWDPWKGSEYIYEVASYLPSDYVVLVIGDKFDTRHTNNIIHIKTMPNEELPNYYSIADVYMSTSQCESLGLTTCEAQICGIPVVAFGHTAIKETFTDKTGILVGEDNNSRKMANAIIKIVEEKPFNKDDIIANGERFAKYSSSKKYFEYYKKTLEKK